MSRHEITDTFTKDVQMPIGESVAPGLFPPNCKLELNAKVRIMSLLCTGSPSILAQEQFTKNEWSILTTLLASYPHYTPYEILLASLTSLSSTDSRKRLQNAQLAGSKPLKQELKPVHRALSGVRVKVHNLSPHLKISLVRHIGYSLTSDSNDSSPLIIKK